MLQSRARKQLWVFESIEQIAPQRSSALVAEKSFVWVAVQRSIAAVALPLFPTSADLSQNPLMADPSHPVTAMAVHQQQQARLLQSSWRLIRKFSPSARGLFSIRLFL